MKYMGSKARIAKYILPIILKDRKPGQWFVEPFCGGCNITDKVDGNRIANDSNEYLIAFWKALISGWIPPTHINEAEYNHIKNNKDLYPKELVAFTGLYITFGSKWFGGYARNKRGTNFCLEGMKNLKKQVERLTGVHFHNCDYDKLLIPNNSIVYLDPPYKNSVGYIGKFDSDKLYEFAIKISKNNIVFLSEYDAPDNFKCVFELKLQQNMGSDYVKPTEKLFTL